jgi:ABC-type sugar transport system ATPase subunit
LLDTFAADVLDGDRTRLRAIHLHKRFGAVHAVRGVSLDVRAGEVVALLGENGAGKSSLIAMLSGAQPTDSGRIEIAGETHDSLDPAGAARLKIAAIRQEPVLVSTLSVAENLLMGRLPSRWGAVRRGAMFEQARAWLDAVDARVNPGALVGSLSPADRQLVEIARCVGSGARVLFFDEPTAALGPAETDRLFRLIRRLAAGGAGIVYVSHRLEEVFAVCDRVVVLRDGSVVREAPTGEMDERSLVSAMAGRELLEQEMREAKQRHAGEAPLVRVSGLGSDSRLRGVDLVVAEGEIHGLAGIVGSGRSRLLSVLSGLRPHDQGIMELGGLPYAPRSPHAAIRSGVVLVPEDRLGSALFQDLSQAVNVVFSRHEAAASLGLISHAREAAAAASSLERLDVRPADSGMRGGALSGGNQQKLIVARALFAGPRLLLLDEPTRGVDVGAKADIHRLLIELADEGMTVILVSSDMRELMALSDRITVMARGSTTGTFSPPFDPQRLIAAATAEERRPA